MKIKLLLLFLLISNAMTAMEKEAEERTYLSSLPNELKEELAQFKTRSEEDIKKNKDIIENWTYPSRFVFSRIDVDVIKRLATLSDLKKYFAEFVNPSTGMTPLMKAAEMGNHELVTLFLNAEIDINKQDKDGLTALMYAAIAKDKSLMDLLIKKGAKADIKNKNGETATEMLKNSKEHTRMRVMF